MHIEILVEDHSGRVLLESAMQNISGTELTFRVHSYKGVGRIPKNLTKGSDVQKRILLQELPRLLAGYGTAFSKHPPGYNAAVIVVCDLDDKDYATFISELQALLNLSDPRPEAYFCVAIEEGEAWLLGDLKAIKSAYPNAKDKFLNSYVNDSICGTWELLADAIYPGGAAQLVKRGYPDIGIEKAKWASKITPLMNMEENKSPSFCAFRDRVRRLDHELSQ